LSADLVHPGLRSAELAAKAHPYVIKPGGRAFIVWHIDKDRTWREVATFARRAHAEAFVIAMAEDLLDDCGWS
jgi:hypothetical protein